MERNLKLLIVEDDELLAEAVGTIFPARDGRRRLCRMEIWRWNDLSRKPTS